jgi:ribosomal protein S18 acetylase RimI-like enzyme
MFLAYEVKAATSKKDYLSKPLVLDLDSVYHKRQLLADSSSSSSKDVDFVKGDLIGFVEITQRAYGLGDTVSSDDSDMLRPVLTNLAVRHDARKSGIGSKLLDVCEQHIVKNWNMNECVLEVEDYNTRANKWYQNRGYRVLFSDPAARRYDVSGVVLKKVRGQRDIMRKVLTLQQAQQADSETLSVSKAYSRILAQLRETVGV